MITRFTTQFKEASAFDMYFRPDVNLSQGTIFSTDLFSLTSVLCVKEPGKFLFKTVSGSRFNNLLRDVVEAAVSKDFTPDELGPVKDAIKNSKISVPKLLVYYKLLEEIAVRSEDETVWREAMNILATPLYETGAPAAGTKTETICISCLSAIHERCSDRSKQEMYSQIMSGARKIDFYLETLCGSLFTRVHRGREQRAVIALADAEAPMILAALVAHSLRSSQALPVLRIAPDPKSPWLLSGPELLACALTPDLPLEGVLDKLVRSGGAIDPQEGKAMIMALARGDPYARVDSEVYETLVRGFREILSMKMLPHPWFMGNSRNGFAVPKLDPNGIQMASFLSLAIMPSPLALDAAVVGVTELVVPHIHGVGPQGVRTEASTVRDSIGLVHHTLYELLSRNPAIQPFQADDAMRLLFAHPEQLSPEQMHEGALLALSPLFGRVAMRSARIGAQDSPVSRIALDCLVKALGSGPEERRIETFMRLQEEMFGSGSHLPEPGHMRDFLRLVAKRADGRLPPSGPKGRIKQG